MERSCLICGKPIPADRRSNNTKYCSVSCARRAERQQKLGYISRRANAHNKIAPHVYTAYGSKCAICSWTACEGTATPSGKAQPARGNEIHHIIPVSKGGTDSWDNVVLLCPNHHKQADLGLITPEELQNYCIPYRLTDEETAEAKRTLAEAVADIIF